MTAYRYVFRRLDVELSADLRLDHPIAHLEVGNSLVISNRHLDLSPGHHFVVRHIETAIELVQPPVGEVLVSTVYLAERNRRHSPVR